LWFLGGVTNESYIQTLLDYVEQNYGGFTEYALQALEIDETAIQNLKTHLLE